MPTIIATDDAERVGDTNPLPVDVKASVLPSGASTSALQTAIIAAIVAVGATALLILAAVNGVVSADNSSNVPLPADTGGADHIFTGAAVEILDAGIVFVSISTDAASATDGLVIQQSSDGANWDHDDVYTVPANGNKNYAINPFAKYLRVVYTNGVIAQTYFRLQTIVKSNSLPSSHRIQDAIVGEDDARLGKSVLAGQDPSGIFRNVNTTEDGNLTVSDNSSGLSIAQGNVTGLSFIHKFGAAPDFDISDGLVTVWDGADDGTTWELMEYVYSTTDDIDTCSSSSASDTQNVELQGLDINYDLVIQTISLDGQNKSSLTTDLIRLFRVKNINNVDLVGHVFCYVDGTITLGVPDTNADIRAIIQPGNNQTLMAVFTIPASQTGYMRDWYASAAGAKKTSSHTVRLIARPFGQVFQLKHTANINVLGTSYIKHDYVEPEVFAEKTDIEIQMDTDQDEAGVAAGFDIVLADN